MPHTKPPGFERSMIIKIAGLIIFAIDGIITDGTVIIDDCGHEQKRFNFKDINECKKTKEQLHMEYDSWNH